ncbi:unnamed protein product [Allacma fusca]|uniref:F5/8 type C domain-containing protein n=1 Tax=Allacma fusca TaxID=39272 RepID=A0A8J2KCQ4_9HEXA|nr:unnamed protein product [Allacma fusca]
MVLTTQLENIIEGGEWIGDDCVHPLGMESGKIPTSRITASSSFDEKSVGPQNARLRIPSMWFLPKTVHCQGALCSADDATENICSWLVFPETSHSSHSQSSVNA